jgi:hypothetical protein
MAVGDGVQRVMDGVLTEGVEYIVYVQAPEDATVP